MKKSVKIWLLLATLVAVALLSTVLAIRSMPPLHLPPRGFRHIPGDIEVYYTVETVISTINATLLIFLLITYIGIYKKTRSEFTIGLIIFSMVLLLNVIVSNPLIHMVFGFGGFGLGPFAMLPGLFTFVALVILLYLTIKY